MQLLRYLIAILVITTGPAACRQKEKSVEESPAALKTNVTIVQPVKQSLTDFLELNGNTVFQKKVVVRANIAGYIINIPWKVGDRISSGSVFCNIKTKEQDALKNIDQREPSLKQFQQPIKIITSASGFITAVNYITGDFVNEGDVLATITIPSSLVLSVNVPYEYHAYVYNGRSCQVVLPDGKKINTAITLSVPVIDPASQTQQYFIQLPASEKLPENMNLLVRIPMKQKTNVLCLPFKPMKRRMNFG
jgi:biotin carboxyl carrier protein